MKKKSPGRPRTATGPDNVALVRNSIHQSPRRSSRKHAAALHLSDRSVLPQNLKMHPYKIVMVQELSDRDFDTLTMLCHDFIENVYARNPILKETEQNRTENVRCTDVVLFADEAHFHLIRAVNKQNFRYWSENNPREIYQCSLHSPKVTVWCAIF